MPANRKPVRMLFLLASGILLLSASASPCPAYAAGQEPEERQLFAMTTVMNLRAYGDDDSMNAALDAAEKKIRDLDSLLSTGTKGSEVFRINRSGGGTLSADTAFLTEAALSLYRETDGAFDFTIYPIMDLWGFTRLFDEDAEAPDTEAAGELSPSGTEAFLPEGRGSSSSEPSGGTGSGVPDTLSSNERLIRHVPTEKEIDALLPLVDSSKVVYDPEAPSLALPKDAEIDFGGIAKGYTSQKIMEIYQSHGLLGGLADLGGNIQVTGSKPDGSPWRVGVEDPLDSSALLGVLTLRGGCAVITSGSYERYLVGPDGKRYSHIIDPSTGYPVDNDLLSVSIVCEDGTLGDGLSTSLCVMGKEKAISFWKARSSDFDMVLFDTDHTVTVSAGLADSFSSDRYETEVVHAG